MLDSLNVVLYHSLIKVIAMKIKTNSTRDLIEMSEGVREEITRDVLDVFGIDLSKQEIIHHEKTKPVWTQQIRDNKSLKNELDSFLSLIKNNLKQLPEMMQFEKDHPLIISENSSKDSIAYDLEFLWICESHVQKFDKEKYLAKDEIVRYNAEIQELKDTIRRITVDYSLSS
ncbi:MAG TPA: hypothetical protein VFP45_05570 [Candidatus Nitrosotalea sp.]|nr:hypothetical protein [Candidatus Nitrosotalea sp.]